MKIALLADLHLGVKKSDLVFQQSQLRFFKNQFVPELIEKEIDTIVVCGDVFDTRQTLNVNTENVVIDLFKNVFANFKVHIIVGNHDIYHTTTTEVNSLKSLDLLPNVTVYEKPTDIEFDGNKVLMLPWITNYIDFDMIVLEHYKYSFAHLDVVGFDMGSNNLSTEGLYVKQIIDKIDHTYTGHYHTRSRREYQDGQTITYIGSPYQINRGDRNQARGYGILDFSNGNFEWVDNHESMLFTKYIYPDVNEEKITGNQVDIEIPYDKINETKKIYDLVERLNKLKPAYPVNTFNGDNPNETTDMEIEVDQLNLLTIFKSYVDQLETDMDKTEIYNELVKLYDTFRGVNSQMKLETFEQWKAKICNGAISNLPMASAYRYADVLDYVCRNLDLDKNFDSIIERVTRREFGTSLYEEYMETHHTDNLKRQVAEEIIAVMEEKIKEGIY